MQYAVDLIFCPVVAWTKIIQQLWIYPSTTKDTHVNSFYSKRKIYKLSADDMGASLKAAVSLIGEAMIGFHCDNIGTHLLRSGAAMVIYLAKIPVYIIMLTGRW